MIALAAVLLLAVVFGNAWGGVQYTLTDLGPLAGNDAHGINDSGQVVGTKDFGSGSHAFLYSGGTMSDLGTLYSGQSYSYAVDINNAGQIVGVSRQTSTSGSDYAFLYSGGVMSEIPGLGGNYYDAANGINNLGQVVGISARPDRVTHAFLYSGGTTTDLGSLTGTGGYSDAYGINDHTQVVGNSTDVNGRDRGFLWQNGTMSDLGDLDGGSGHTYAYQINNLGQVVGESWQDSSSPHHAFIWQNGVMTDLGLGLAEGINDSGVVVGGNINGLFVWDSVNGMQDANKLLDSSGAGWNLYGCRAINNLGQIAGWGEDSSGQIHGILLTPVSEPSTLVLLGIGAIGSLAYVLRIQRRKAIRLVLLLSGLFFTPSFLFADTATFDFNSGIGPYFSVFNSGLFNVTTDGPEIIISKPADDGTVAPVDAAGIHSNFSVVGNFSITVDFTLTDFPLPNQSQGLNESLLRVISMDYQSNVEILRYTYPALGNRIEGFSTPSGFPGGRSSSLMIGRYQLQRTGSIITASFANPGSSSFTQLGSVSGFPDPMSIELLAVQNQNVIGYPRSTTALDISFDNLSVVADQIQGIPEPSTLVLLGMGAIALLAYAWRRRRSG
jgi:probable HAF family extracellular repeat protein